MARLFIICMMFFSCNLKSMQDIKNEAISYETVQFQQQSDTILDGIESKINQAFVQSQMAKNAEPLNKLSSGLEIFSKTRSNNLITYWQSYLKFYESIFYLSVEDNKTAEKVCSTAIELLDKMKGKNAEDYALLALIRGFSIQFSPGMKAAFVSKKVAGDLEAAMAIDSSNLRVNYVIANNDFYTPEQYGGGKKIEYYALKAISLPNQKTPNNYLPSWGKEGAYETLIKFYIKKEKWQQAKRYYKEANAVFPNSYLIGQLAPQLIDK